MSKKDNFIDNKIVQNLFIWFYLFLFFSIAIQGTQNRFISGLIAILFLAPPVYIENFFIIPFLKKNNVKFWIFSFVNILFFAVLTTFFLEITTGEPIFDISTVIIFFSLILLTVLFGSALKIARDSFYRRQQEKEAELKLLKAQLNPHFLFNTLNNLYGLSVVKSDKLPNLMLKLSDLLRYSLYETKEELVPLSKEIEYLENYISLEKIRLENTEINFSVNGNINEKEIAPMLFIVFVENAFKHLSSNKSKVDITITSEENKLQFSCRNSMDTILPLEENLEKGKSGIGLVNAKKRLALIYPEKHQLKIDTKNDSFSVDLTLEL